MPKAKFRNPKRKTFYADMTQGALNFISKRKRELSIRTSVDYLKHLLIKDGCDPLDLIFKRRKK